MFFGRILRRTRWDESNKGLYFERTPGNDIDDVDEPALRYEENSNVSWRQQIEDFIKGEFTVL